MKYSLDTNVLIDAWREWYSTTSHPTFWERLEKLAENGQLKISDTVLWELEEVEGDTLTEWCKEREEVLCHPSDSMIQKSVRELGIRYANFVNSAFGAKNFADPFVVAVAMQNQDC